MSEHNRLPFLPSSLAGRTERLAVNGEEASTVHVFDSKSIHAINAALAAGRPLLLRGEPGTGKSQLARAAAQALSRKFVSYAVDSQTEGRDLRWSIDAVGRLGKAQILGSLSEAAASERAKKMDMDLEQELEERNFVQPGPLWWAFDWDMAEDQAKRSHATVPAQVTSEQPLDGTVVLIDEIDKADSSVPNAMLQALAERRFTTPWGEEVQANGDVPPLVIFTTNEERVLPNAFLRRCMVLQLALPGGDLTDEGLKNELVAWLVARGQAHFASLDQRVTELAATLVVGERAKQGGRLYRPGQAEFLDLLRALDRYLPEQHPDCVEEQVKLLNDINGFASFALQKTPGQI